MCRCTDRERINYIKWTILCLPYSYFKGRWVDFTIVQSSEYTHTYTCMYDGEQIIQWLDWLKNHLKRIKHCFYYYWEYVKSIGSKFFFNYVSNSRRIFITLLSGGGYLLDEMKRCLAIRSFETVDDAISNRQRCYKSRQTPWNRFYKTPFHCVFLNILLRSISILRFLDKFPHINNTYKIIQVLWTIIF
jgi:hypothetical protein